MAEQTQRMRLNPETSAIRALGELPLVKVCELWKKVMSHGFASGPDIVSNYEKWSKGPVWMRVSAELNSANTNLTEMINHPNWRRHDEATRREDFKTARDLCIPFMTQQTLTALAHLHKVYYLCKENDMVHFVPAVTHIIEDVELFLKSQKLNIKVMTFNSEEEKDEVLESCKSFDHVGVVAYV